MIVNSSWTPTRHVTATCCAVRAFSTGSPSSLAPNKAGQQSTSSNAAALHQLLESVLDVQEDYDLTQSGESESIPSQKEAPNETAIEPKAETVSQCMYSLIDQSTRCHGRHVLCRSRSSSQELDSQRSDLTTTTRPGETVDTIPSKTQFDPSVPSRSTSDGRAHFGSVRSTRVGPARHEPYEPVAEGRVLHINGQDQEPRQDRFTERESEENGQSRAQSKGECLGPRVSWACYKLVPVSVSGWNMS